MVNSIPQNLASLSNVLHLVCGQGQCHEAHIFSFLVGLYTFFVFSNLPLGLSIPGGMTRCPCLGSTYACWKSPRKILSFHPRHMRNESSTFNNFVNACEKPNGRELNWYTFPFPMGQKYRDAQVGILINLNHPIPFHQEGPSTWKFLPFWSEHSLGIHSYLSGWSLVSSPPSFLGTSKRLL